MKRLPGFVACTGRMHAIPALSAFTAVTELFVTAAIFYVGYRALVDDVLETRLLAGALTYEVVFNISYMTSRLFTHDHASHHPDWLVALLVGHGVLSLVMFVGLLALSWAAWRRHRQGGNLLAERLGLTATFAVLWTVSILSGEAVFLLEYVGHY